MTEIEEKNFQVSIQKYFDEVNALCLKSKFVKDLLSIVDNVVDYHDSIISYQRFSGVTGNVANCAKEFFYESKLTLYKSLCEFVHEFDS